MTSEAATFADDGGLHGPRERMSAGLRLYLVFSVSWFLHVPARFEFLGVLRVDLVLVLILIVLALSGSAEKSFASTSIDKRLKWLLVLRGLVGAAGLLARKCRQGRPSEFHQGRRFLLFHRCLRQDGIRSSSLRPGICRVPAVPGARTAVLACHTGILGFRCLDGRLGVPGEAVGRPKRRR